MGRGQAPEGGGGVDFLLTRYSLNYWPYKLAPLCIELPLNVLKMIHDSTQLR